MRIWHHGIDRVVIRSMHGVSGMSSWVQGAMMGMMTPWGADGMRHIHGVTLVRGETEICWHRNMNYLQFARR